MTEIVTSGSMSGERKRDYGRPTRARSRKRRTQTRKAYRYRAAPQLYLDGQSAVFADWSTNLADSSVGVIAEVPGVVTAAAVSTCAPLHSVRRGPSDGPIAVD